MLSSTVCVLIIRQLWDIVQWHFEAVVFYLSQPASVCDHCTFFVILSLHQVKYFAAVLRSNLFVSCLGTLVETSRSQVAMDLVRMPISSWKRLKLMLERTYPSSTPTRPTRFVTPRTRWRTGPRMSKFDFSKLIM